MKTPEEWIKESSQSGPFDLIDSSADAAQLIVAIQRDALSGTLGAVTGFTPYQEALTFAEAPDEIRRLNHNVEVYKERWHQARRYLRAANKGAERNNQVMRLLAHDNAALLDRIKQLELCLSQINLPS